MLSNSWTSFTAHFLKVACLQLNLKKDNVNGIWGENVQKTKFKTVSRRRNAPRTSAGGETEGFSQRKKTNYQILTIFPRKKRETLTRWPNFFKVHFISILTVRSQTHLTSTMYIYPFSGVFCLLEMNCTSNLFQLVLKMNSSNVNNVLIRVIDFIRTLDGLLTMRKLKFPS